MPPKGWWYKAFPVVCVFNNIQHFHFQAITGVNTEQLDELIKMIMIVRATSRITFRSPFDCSFTLCVRIQFVLTASDTNLQREFGILLYGRNLSSGQANNCRTHRRARRDDRCE